MKRRNHLIKGFLGLALMASLTVAAMAATACERTIMMGPGAGAFTIQDLGVGDSVMLTLVNPTNCPLVFETSEALVPQTRWIIPPNSRQTVTFQYNRPFNTDVAFTIREVDGTPIAQGVLIPGMPAPQPASYTIQPETKAPVRGYW